MKKTITQRVQILSSKVTGMQKAFMLIILLFTLVNFGNAQVTYISGAQSQTDLTMNKPYGQGTKDQRIIRLEVKTDFGGADLTLNNLTVSLTGVNNISRVAVYQSTGTYNVELSKMLGEAINPSASQLITFTANNTITPNSNLTQQKNTIYWVTIDIKADATLDDIIDAEITGITAGGSVQTTPSIANNALNNNAIVKAPLTGIKTVKNSGGDYLTMRDVLNAINAYGVGTGGVEFVFQDDQVFDNGNASGSYSYIVAIHQTGTAANPITLRRSGDGTNRPQITQNGGSSSGDQLLGIYGADYVTVDGLDFRGIDVSPQVHEYGIMVTATANTGLSHLEIKNCNITLQASPNKTRVYGMAFVQSGLDGVNTSSQIFSDIKVHDNSISNVDGAIVFGPQIGSLTFENEQVEVYNNTITGNFGHEHGAIHLIGCKDAKIYNNTIDGIGTTQTYSGNPVRGINAYSRANNSTIECYGNTIKNISLTSTTTNKYIYGITIIAPTVKIYNNMIFGLTNTSAYVTKVVGIYCGTDNTINPAYKIWNNTVYLNQASPIDPLAAATTAPLMLGSNQACAGIELKNNIFINTSTGANVTMIRFDFQNENKMDASTDNNIYYPESPSTANAGYFYIGGTGTKQQASVSLYKTYMATRDQNSVSELPSFVSATDLHLTAAPSISGIAIAEVTTDIDGELRNNPPFVGADEIPAPTVSVDFIELTGFTYLQGAGPSAEQSFEVSGSYLTSDITVTPPANYEISTTSGSGFVSTPITLTKTGNSVAATLIYVRLKAGLAVATYNGEQITAVSSTSTKTVTVSGSVDVSTSVDNPSDNIKVLTNGSKIVIIGAAGKSAEIYNSVGMKLASVKNMEAATEMSINAKGLMLVKIDSKVAKVIIK